MPADLHDRPDVDALYDLDPGAFVARDALAKEVRSDDKEVAKAIKALRRPTVTAWAVNRAARARAEDVARLLELGVAMRSAKAASLREAMGERRRLIASLADDAVELAGEEHRTEIEPTIEAASLDAELSVRLRQGHLERAASPSASGFEQLLSLAPGELSASDSDDGDADDEAAERERRAELRRRLDEAEAEVARRQRSVGDAEDRLADAEAALAQERTALDAAHAQRDALVEELGEA